MSDSFSSELWQGVTGVYDSILAHPFLTGLTDGSLPHDAFVYGSEDKVPSMYEMQGTSPGLAA